MLDDFMQKAKANSLKRHLAVMIGARYQEHEEIVERISTMLVTDADLQKFANLLGNIYSTAYDKCVNDHRKELHRLGIRSSVKQEQS
jgi:hypothetical protein